MMLPFLNDGLLLASKASALGRPELWRMKSLYPSYFGWRALAGPAGGRDQLRVRLLADVPDGRAVETGVGAHAGSCRSSTCGRRSGTLKGWMPSFCLSPSTSRGIGRVPQVEDGERAVAGVAGRVGVAAVAVHHAGDGVGAGRGRRPRPMMAGAGVGDVHDDDLLAVARVDVVRVAGRGLVEVDADQREPLTLAVDHPLTAVHRLVLEHRVRAGRRPPWASCRRRRRRRGPTRARWSRRARRSA